MRPLFYRLFMGRSFDVPMVELDRARFKHKREVLLHTVVQRRQDRGEGRVAHEATTFGLRNRDEASRDAGGVEARGREEDMFSSAVWPMTEYTSNALSENPRRETCRGA